MKLDVKLEGKGKASITNQINVVRIKVVLMDEIYDIRWNDNIVGSFTVDSHDMWYFEGQFTPCDSEIATKFYKLASNLEVGQVLGNFDLGLPTILHGRKGPQNEWHTIIMGFIGEKLHLRGVTYISKKK